MERWSGAQVRSATPAPPAFPPAYVGRPQQARRIARGPVRRSPRPLRSILGRDQVRATRSARAASVPAGSASAAATPAGLVRDRVGDSTPIASASRRPTRPDRRSRRPVCRAPARRRRPHCTTLPRSDCQSNVPSPVTTRSARPRPGPAGGPPRARRRAPGTRRAPSSSSAKPSPPAAPAPGSRASGRRHARGSRRPRRQPPRSRRALARAAAPAPASRPSARRSRRWRRGSPAAARRRHWPRRARPRPSPRGRRPTRPGRGDRADQGLAAPGEPVGGAAPRGLQQRGEHPGTAVIGPRAAEPDHDPAGAGRPGRQQQVPDPAGRRRPRVAAVGRHEVQAARLGRLDVRRRRPPSGAGTSRTCAGTGSPSGPATVTSSTRPGRAAPGRRRSRARRPTGGTARARRPGPAGPAVGDGPGGLGRGQGAGEGVGGDQDAHARQSCAVDLTRGSPAGRVPARPTKQVRTRPPGPGGEGDVDRALLPGMRLMRRMGITAKFGLVTLLLLLPLTIGVGSGFAESTGRLQRRRRRSALGCGSPRRWCSSSSSWPRPRTPPRAASPRRGACRRSAPSIRRSHEVGAQLQAEDAWRQARPDLDELTAPATPQRAVTLAARALSACALLLKHVRGRLRPGRRPAAGHHLRHQEPGHHLAPAAGRRGRRPLTGRQRGVPRSSSATACGPWPDRSARLVGRRRAPPPPPPPGRRSARG